jgi:hypothetical protein
MTIPSHDIKPWFIDGLQVSRSDIHGEGLRTTIPISRGVAVIRFGGCLFHISARHAGNVMRSTSTCLSEDVFLAEPVDSCKDMSDYINHSCDPNLGMIDAITLFAVRDIAAGEELVIDYSFWEGDMSWQLKHECNCGGRACRKRVTGTDWKAVMIDEERFLYYAPFLKRRIIATKTKGVLLEN